MSFTLAGLICIGAWVAVAAIARGQAAARAALAVPVALLPLPWFAPLALPHSVFLAFAIGVLLMSSADFAYGHRPPTFLGRLAYVFAFSALINSSTRERVTRHLDVSAIRRIVVALCAMGVAIVSWSLVSAALPAVRAVVRVLSAATVILATAEASNDLVRVTSALFGVRFADVHDHPYRSTTLSDFWGRRWNRTAARWFRQHTFLPARAAGVAIALFALFAVSALMHAYLVAAAIPMPWTVAAFFLAQPPLLLLERRMKVRRWPVLAARTWTITTLSALLPLLLIPLGFSL